MTIIRSRVTVACWLETLGCWMTSEALVGSRPRIELSRRRVERARREQRERDRRVMQGDRHPPRGELRSKVERGLLARAELSPGRRGGAGAIDEEELAAALVDDAGMLGHHPLAGQDHVT